MTTGTKQEHKGKPEGESEGQLIRFDELRRAKETSWPTLIKKYISFERMSSLLFDYYCYTHIAATSSRVHEREKCGKRTYRGQTTGRCCRVQ